MNDKLSLTNINNNKNNRFNSINEFIYDECIIDSKSEKLMRYYHNNDNEDKNSEENATHQNMIECVISKENDDEKVNDEDNIVAKLNNKNDCCSDSNKINDKVNVIVYLKNHFLTLHQQHKSNNKVQYNAKKRRNGLVMSYNATNNTRLNRQSSNSSANANKRQKLSSINSESNTCNTNDDLHFDKTQSQSENKKLLYERLSKQIKAARQLGILLGAFLITWMPYFVVFIVVAFCPTCVSDNIYTVTIWLGYFNSAINPILYPLCNSAFKHAFRKMFHLPLYNKYQFINIMNYTSN